MIRSKYEERELFAHTFFPFLLLFSVCYSFEFVEDIPELIKAFKEE